MRIISWNCNGALRRKIEQLSKLDGDICVVQECEDPSQTSDLIYKKWAGNFLWKGNNKNKGLGIFCKKNIELANNNWVDNDTKYFIAARVNNSFNVIAVWNHQFSGDFFVSLRNDGL
jgi:exonuclease III